MTGTAGWRQGATRALPWITALWVFVEVLSLRLGLLNRFFFDTLHADTQGIDFYSLPKAWLNLVAGKSMYATFDPPSFGPHFTWYLAHPILAVVFGAPLSRLAPENSYGAFTLILLAAMAISAWLLAREAANALVARVIWLLMLGAFPTFLMLWVGNIQAFTVLGLTLLFVGLRQLASWRWYAPWFMRAGLLLCLFTKPVVLLMLPLLLLVKETRRSAFDALSLYIPVSLLCQVIPAINPERISLGRVFWLAHSPGYVQRTMNIYTDGFHLTPDMRDNTVHWFNLVAQSGFRLQHIDVYSLPVFLDGLTGARTPAFLYWLPTLVVLVLSFWVARVRERARRIELALLLVLAASLDFFVAYPTAWEYQYTAVLPVAGTLLLLRRSTLLGRLWAPSVALACCAWLPTLYFLSGASAPGSGVLLLTRLDRVLPVTVLFVLLLWTVVRGCMAERQPQTRRAEATTLATQA